ncbi:MAG: LPS export ABC transporter permease LptF [Pseudomonadota bacterium]
MNVLDRYLFKQLSISFLIVLGVLTGIVWLTTSLRQLEVMTTQGQTLGIFLVLTTLAIPLLLMNLAPFSLFIGSVFTLNKMSNDSELVVMSASGVSQPQILRPFVMLTCLAMLGMWLLTLVIVPASMRELRISITNVRADLLGSIIQPGKFTTIDKGVTFHVRNRATNGALLGVFVSDQRDDEMEMTYLSDKGLIIRTKEGTFLILENGQIIRRPKGKEFGSIIAFDRYAFNLSSLMGVVADAQFKPAERSTAELFNMSNDEGETRAAMNAAHAELHDRLAIPLYAMAFMLIAFAALGKVRTIRQAERGRTIGFAIASVVILRMIGFAMSALTQSYPAAAILIYLVPLAGIAVALVLGPFGKTFPLPHFPVFKTRDA